MVGREEEGGDVGEAGEDVVEGKRRWSKGVGVGRDEVWGGPNVGMEKEMGKESWWWKGVGENEVGGGKD